MGPTGTRRARHGSRRRQPNMMVRVRRARGGLAGAAWGTGQVPLSMGATGRRVDVRAVDGYRRGRDVLWVW